MPEQDQEGQGQTPPKLTLVPPPAAPPPAPVTPLQEPPQASGSGPDIGIGQEGHNLGPPAASVVPDEGQSAATFRDIYSAGSQSVIEAFKAERDAQRVVEQAKEEVSNLQNQTRAADTRADVALVAWKDAKAKTVKCVKAQVTLLSNYLSEESGAPK